MKNSGEFLDAIASLIWAWREFRASHDVKSAKLSCCDKTERLFYTLEQLDDVIERSKNDE